MNEMSQESAGYSKAYNVVPPGPGQNYRQPPNTNEAILQRLLLLQAEIDALKAKDEDDPSYRTREPAKLATTLSGTVIGLLAAGGWALQQGQVDALQSVVAVLVPLFVSRAGGEWIRSQVYSKPTVEKMKGGDGV